MPLLDRAGGHRVVYMAPDRDGIARRVRFQDGQPAPAAG